MITIPVKNKNNITYKEKIAQKTDYVIIVNDETSSNVSDLFIIWNQKAKVFISSELSDFYNYLKTNKITKKYNVLIIGSSKTEYKEIEKYYLRILDNKTNKLICSLSVSSTVFSYLERSLPDKRENAKLYYLCFFAEFDIKEVYLNAVLKDSRMILFEEVEND